MTTGLSKPQILQAHTLNAPDGWMVASGVQPRPSDQKSEATNTRPVDRLTLRIGFIMLKILSDIKDVKNHLNKCIYFHFITIMTLYNAYIKNTRQTNH